MKYIVVLGDGMADEPMEQLNGSTPLACAKTPVMDELAAKSEMGMVTTIPEGMSPGSDTANLSVMGYDPKKYYTGRSPLEALSIGVPMIDTDVAFRCNIVTLSEEEDVYEERTIIDHSSDEIETEDSTILMKAVVEQLSDEDFKFYGGTSYRHCLIWDKGELLDLVPPHDVLGQVIAPHLPKNPRFLELQKKSYEILSKHPLNMERKKKGLKPANSFWFWGAGTTPILTSYEDIHHKKGLMISAVDLLKGIAVGAHMDTVNIPGANGGLHTNYEGKAEAAVKALTQDGYDFVYVHVEAPDEMGHQGSLEKKIQAIENLDQRVIKIIKDGLDAAGEEYRMLIMPDHPTPIRLRTHTSDPIPYLLYDSTKEVAQNCRYTEAEVAALDKPMMIGHELMGRLLEE